MKIVLLLVSVVFSSQCLAGSERLEYAKEWLANWLPETMEFNVDSFGVKFQGCKQKEYQLKLRQPITSDFSIETAASYAKARLSWGVFSQKLTMQEISIIPRYHVSHNWSLGFGVISQSAAEFKSTVGVEVDLPSNTEWLLSARTQGFANKHTWELSVSTQKWEATRSKGTWYETGSANSKINLLYIGYF